MSEEDPVVPAIKSTAEAGKDTITPCYQSHFIKVPMPAAWQWEKDLGGQRASPQYLHFIYK